MYNRRTITDNEDHVTLATVDDCVTAEFVTPEDDEGTPSGFVFTSNGTLVRIDLDHREDECLDATTS